MQEALKYARGEKARRDRPSRRAERRQRAQSTYEARPVAALGKGVSSFLPPSTPITLYIDADACPVKQEVYRVAERHALKGVALESPRRQQLTDRGTARWVCPPDRGRRRHG